MQKTIVKRLLMVQIFTNLTHFICPSVDSIITGRFLGLQALAAVGCVNPLSLLLIASGATLAAGAQVHCGKALGMGSQKELNAALSSALITCAALSLFLVSFVLLFRFPFASLLTTNGSAGLSTDTANYLAGYILSAPGLIGTTVLAPFLVVSGQSNALVVALALEIILDTLLDLLNALLFHWGLFGMGLATALTYGAALIFVCVLLSSGSALRFSWKDALWKRIIALFVDGFPVATGILSTTIMLLEINFILMRFGGTAAVGAFTVIYTVGNNLGAVSIGVGDVSRMLYGICYEERDIEGMQSLTRLIWRYSLLICLVVGALVCALAPRIVSLFFSDAGHIEQIIVLGIRIYCIGLIPGCFNFALKGLYQATGAHRLGTILPIMEYACYPVLATFVMSLLFAEAGGTIYYAAGELLTFLSLMVIVILQTRSLPWKNGSYLLLDHEKRNRVFLQADVASLDDVLSFSRKAGAFSQAHGSNAAVSTRIALCIEEMGTNVIRHGFPADGKEHHLSIKLQKDGSDWVLRFRDDCLSFDPIHYLPSGTGDSDSDKASGIRLTLAIVSDADYTYSLRLNNLRLNIPVSTGDRQEINNE